MDTEHFDGLARLASASRRRALRATLVASLSGPLPLLALRDAAATCRSNGEPCKRGAQCCSGVCEGKPGRRRCRRAFSQRTCTTKLDACAQGENSEVTGCGNDVCFCWVTTRGASLCGQLVEVATDCAFCAQTFPGTVCVRGGVGECRPEPFACVQPCPS